MASQGPSAAIESGRCSVGVSDIIAGYAAVVATAGDHPVRVITAGVSDEHLDYIFMPGRIEVLKSPTASPHAGLEIPDLHSLGAPVAPPLPGIILPRDAGSRMLPDDAIAALLACGVKLRDDGEAHFAGMSDEDLSQELVLNLDGKLRGWVRLSTGEEFSTEP